MEALENYKFGLGNFLKVKTGTRVKTAKEKIPDIIVVEARPKRYVEIHNQIVEVVSKHFEKIQVLSIDEMACIIDEEDDFKPLSFGAKLVELQRVVDIDQNKLEAFKELVLKYKD